MAERRPSHWKNLYRLDIFHGRPSGKGSGDPMALNKPKTPPNPPVFPIVRSITTPTVIFVIFPLSLKVIESACGGHSTFVPVASNRPASFPACVPVVLF